MSPAQGDGLRNAVNDHPNREATAHRPEVGRDAIKHAHAVNATAVDARHRTGSKHHFRLKEPRDPLKVNGQTGEEEVLADGLVNFPPNDGWCRRARWPAFHGSTEWHVELKCGGEAKVLDGVHRKPKKTAGLPDAPSRIDLASGKHVRQLGRSGKPAASAHLLQNV
jgi:hypothetical protein